MKKLKLFSLLMLLFVGVTTMWGATIVEGFESATASTTYNSTQTITTAKSDCSIGWSIYYGSASTTSPIKGNQSCLIRYYTADAKLGYAKTTTAIKGLSNVTFKAKVTNTGNKMGVWYSTNGSDWTALATDVTLTTSASEKSYNIPNSNANTNYYIKIGLTTGSSTNKKDLIIDSIAFTSTTDPTVALTPSSLSNLTATDVPRQKVAISCSNFANPISTVTTGLFSDAGCTAGHEVTSGAWVTDITVNSTKDTVSFNVADNNGAARQLWLKVTATDGSSTVSAILPIAQKALLSTMDDIFAAASSAGSTETDVTIAFNNWVVSGVSTYNAFVTDGTKGFIIYSSSHGFEAGDILSGTVACKVQLYHGSAELTSVTASSTDLTVNTGGSVTPVVLDNEDIAALTGVNTGSIVKVRGTANASKQVAGLQVYGTLYSSAQSSVTANIKYDITGAYVLYDTQKRINPRDAADIQAVPVVTTSTSSLSFTAKQNVAVAGKTFTLTGTSLTNDNLTIAASEGYNVEPTSIPAADAMAGNVDVTVTPATPTTTTTPVEGTITISGGGLEENVVVDLSMAVTPTVLVNVAVSPEGKGTATINGVASAYVAALEEFDLVAAANNPAKYEFAGWTVAAADEEHITFDNANSSTTTAFVNAALTITANFDSITTPSMSVSVEEFDFGQVNINSEPDAQTFTIQGAHLKTAVSLALNDKQGFDDDFEFNVTNGSLTPDEEENVSATVAVKPITTTAGDFVGQLIVISADAGNDTIDLYVTVNKLAAGIEWPADADVVVLGEDHEYLELTNPHSLTVAYSSTNTNAATINASTGAITPVAAGTTTIKATFTTNDTYLAAEVSYTLTVKEKFDVEWWANGELIETTHPLTGDEITAHAAPAALDSKYEQKVFVGWVESELAEATDTKPTLVDFSNMDAEDKTFYALYADTTIGETSTWAITKDNFTTVGTGSGYNPYNGTHALDGIQYESSQVMIQSSAIQFQSGNGYIYNKTAFGTDIESIVIAGTTVSPMTVYEGTTMNPTTSTVTITDGVYTFSSGKRYFRIKMGSATGRVNSITLTLAAPITYSKYVTTVPEKSATALENVETSVKAVKVLRNGQLFIEKAGKVYTITGQLVK